jgi:hypothetical protein
MKFLWLASVLIPLALVAAVTYVVVNPLSVFNVGPDALATSLQREVGTELSGYGDVTCKGRGGRYECKFPDTDKGSDPSGSIFFDMRVDDQGCWRALQVNDRGRTGEKRNAFGNCLDVVDFAGLTFL